MDKVILGFPVGECFDTTDFFRARYFKMKRMLATWGHKVIQELTIYGRAMIVDTMIYSRFRFYASVMSLPNEIMDALESDSKAVIWNKDCEFEADDLGTDLDSD